jgi:S1-C subfamily serine protease
MSQFTAQILLASALLAAAPHARGESFLPDESRTNGADTLKAVAPVQLKAASCSVAIGEKPGAPKLMGVVLSPDGYILTKSDETQQMKTLRVWIGDSAADARLVRRDEKLDLVLLKISRSDLPAITWGESLSLKPGQWFTVLTNQEREMRLGVFSATRRPIPNSGAVMGVRFAPAGKGDEGVQIEEVAENGPAQQAGLCGEDVIISLNGQNVTDPGTVRRIIAGMQPGETVKVKYKREGVEAECTVKLASRNRVMKNWVGEDFANYGTSVRTDNYPEVIQHDLPLAPEDMGGALYDLQGRAVGLNIARVDRVTNYALPVEKFLPEVTKWMAEDRGRTPQAAAPKDQDSSKPQ